MVRKTLITLGLLACVSVVHVESANAMPAMAKAALKYYDQFENGCSVDWDSRLAKAGRYYVYKQNGKEGLLDSQGRKLVDAVYSEIIDIDKDVVIVRKGSKYGLVRTDGLEIVLPTYDDISYDLESKFFKAKKGKNYTYLDHSGMAMAGVRSSQRELKVLGVPQKAPKGLSYSLANGGKVTVNGKKYAVTNYAGAKVKTYKGDFFNANYKGGFLIGDKNEFSFYDANMQPLNTIKAETIQELPNGVFEITRTVHGISVVGVAKTVLSFGLDSYGGIADRWFNPGKKHNRREKVKFGYVDHLGNEFVPTKFDYLGNFYMGKAVVMDNDRFGYAEENGSYSVPVEFEDVSVPGLYDRATVIVEKDGKYGHYAMGNGLLTYGYEEARNFVNGLAPVKQSNGKWGYVDKAGREVITAKYDQATSFYDSYAVVKDTGVYSIIDRTGMLVTKLVEAKEVSSFMGGSALVKQADGYYLVDSQGNKLNALPYENLKLFHPLENIRGKW